ncbi:U-box domain-containing protein 39 [Elaeis guineensis]|uniref:RING-type E3 ubiquitin transferase n=1 Tax=Elaeis guineensis var. tenera TaxID=51953 RepID=A0A6I9QR16_ELAGV|nr:U-box domain-containing protein 41 [Elaeis guineensis]
MRVVGSERGSMGSGKTRWKLSFHRSPSSSTTTEAPMEFVCPISRSIMADPVIVPSGQTFERSCIQACRDLLFTPPSLAVGLSPDAPFLLIPNVALRSAILNWCDRTGLPSPLPVSPDDARALVQRLMSSGAVSDGGKAPILETMTPDTPPQSACSSKKNSPSFSPLSSSSSSCSYHSSSSFSSSEIVVLGTEETPTPEAPQAASTVLASNVANPAACAEVDCLEEEISIKLMNSEVSEQEAALAALRQATRESRDRRIALCTPRLLATLRPMLLSRWPGVQVNAAAVLVNLSLEAPNKVRIVRSGAVPPLVEALKNGHPEARDHAAGAIFSLALEDENRAAIGVLGAIAPLLHLFSRPSESHRARRDAGMALYHLSLAGTNRSKIARTTGAVRALLAVAAEEEGAPAGAQGPPLGRLAMMVLCNLAGSAEGRAALMDAGAVAGVVGLMSGAAAPAEEYCVAALYGMSRGSLRFRGLARAAGAEKVLMRVVEAGSPGEVRREMARRTLRAMRGEDDEEALSSAATAGDVNGTVVSDGLMSFRRRFKDFGNGSGPNSAEF